MGHESKTRLATAAILVVVFGSGVLLGVALDSTASAAPAEDTATAQADQQQSGRQRRRSIYSQVSPTDAQQTLIDSIIKEHRVRMRALHDEFKQAYDPRYEAILEDTRDGIAGVLTPEQAAEYRQLLAELDRRREDRDKDR